MIVKFSKGADHQCPRHNQGHTILSMIHVDFCTVESPEQLLVVTAVWLDSLPSLT